MTQSLSNFLFSLVAGGVVLGLIFAAVLIVSQKDKIIRRG
ncbi:MULTISPECIES: photosystem II reaction center X protein [Pseudanabaena]|uniref:Photosystem II reaction center protein X n=2 Tax=Pseudanabaena TaxID=1152 RepID=L8MRM6_9CYAN|nr:MULTISPECIES: photosystem II reaction center X protein [Pseudanabaena]ELS30567.1 Photosystem II reaction center X protein [Pseudanabaena biceps PCC 7429]MDG3497165.1 photosystem II reaction center X protein [Pseudanabaena catenata USMAC16]